MQSVGRKVPHATHAVTPNVCPAQPHAHSTAHAPQNKAEENWGWACQKINSGVMVENGPALDGCAQYRDSDWLGRIRRWPPVMVERMAAFVNLQE